MSKRVLKRSTVAIAFFATASAMLSSVTWAAVAPPACSISPTADGANTTINYVTSGAGGVCDWTVPVGTTSVTVFVLGGGGGGGGGLQITSGSDTYFVGGGGGGGGQISSVTSAVTPGVIYQLSVGEGGTAGTAASSGSAAGNGGDGGSTSFGALVTAAPGTGGIGGSTTGGGSGGNAGATYSGGAGALESPASSTTRGGGGGGAGGGGNGVAALTTVNGGTGGIGANWPPNGQTLAGGGGGGAASYLEYGGTTTASGGQGAGRNSSGTSPGVPARVGVTGRGTGGGGGTGQLAAAGGPSDGAIGGNGRINITYATLLSPAAQSISGTAGTPITATSAMSNSLLSGATFSLDPSSPPLPAGLTVNASTGAISGTPSAAQSLTTVIVRGSTTDPNWGIASVDVTIAAGSGGSGGTSGGTGGGGIPAPVPSPTASATPTPSPTATTPAATALGPVTSAANSGVPAAGVAPGTGVLIVNGEKVSVTVKPDAKDNKLLEVSGPGFTMSLAGLNAQGKPLGLTPDGALILEQDRTAAVAGTGFQPNSLVYLYLFSEPRFLGTVQTDANGSFKGQVPLPADIADGRHTLQSNGFTPDGAVRSLSLGVVLATPAAAAPKRATARVYFESLSSALTGEGVATLKALVAKTGKKGVRTVSIGYVQGTTITVNDEALSTQRAANVAAYLKKLGLRGRFVVRGDGIAKETGATARRVNVSMTYLR